MDLEWYLRRQAGVISRAQAGAAGWSRYAVHRRVASGRWEPLHPGVYLSEGHSYTDEVRVWAAVRWAGSDAVAHGVTAAWWDDLWSRPPATVQVTVPRRRDPGRQPGIAVRRRDLAQYDRACVRDLWLTDVPLTVLEAAVELGAEGSTLLDRALQRRVDFARCTGPTAATSVGWVHLRPPHCSAPQPTVPPRRPNGSFIGVRVALAEVDTGGAAAPTARLQPCGVTRSDSSLQLPLARD